MNRLLVSAALAALLLANGPVRAESDVAIQNDFVHSSQDLAGSALSSGYRQFGDLNLEKYQRPDREVEIEVVGKVAHPEALGLFHFERNSAECRRGHIRLSGSMWAKTPKKTKPMLAMHENLCAQGIYDRDFGCSGSLWALTDPAVRAKLTASDIQRFEQNARQACRFAGGSTGVTGGGDWAIVQAKMNKIIADLSSGRSIDDTERAFYEKFEINRSGKIADFKSFLRVIHLDRCSDPNTIKVFSQKGAIPHDARNGWTYDPKSKSVILHGAAIPHAVDGMGASPGVLCD